MFEGAAMAVYETTITDWIQIVRAEYDEMPGLHLTREQVRRLWSLDAPTCDALLEALVQAQFLRRTSNDAYVRADSSRR
jgi:hypothetical protein